MTPILKIIDRICFLAAAAAAFLLAALFVMGFSEIILRTAFRISLPFSVEYAGYLLVLVMFLGSGWTMSQGGHIRVTLLSEYIPRSLALRIDIACTSVALIVSGILTASMIEYTVGTWDRGTVSYFSSETPLVYPQALFSAGLFVLSLSLLARLLRLLTGQATIMAPSRKLSDDDREGAA